MTDTMNYISRLDAYVKKSEGIRKFIITLMIAMLIIYTVTTIFIISEDTGQKVAFISFLVLSLQLLMLSIVISLCLQLPLAFIRTMKKYNFSDGAERIGGDPDNDNVIINPAFEKELAELDKPKIKKESKKKRGLFRRMFS